MMKKCVWVRAEVVVQIESAIHREDFMNFWGLYVFLALLAIAMLAFTWYSVRRDGRRQQEIATSPL
jgi:ABC-type multidrug transport system permease subunit